MAKIITVFGSARQEKDSPEYMIAYNLGRELASAGFILCNGGFGGMMEASARGAKEAGGKTIGVTFDRNGRKPNQWIDEVVHIPQLIDRMLKLVELGDAYVVLKGGTGTLLELAAVWEYVNKGIMREKPIVLIGDFWQRVVTTLQEELLWEGIGDCTKIIHRVSSPRECADFLQSAMNNER
jgi:hypothetical protein